MANTQLISEYFRLHNVKQFRESISETANSVYYVFAGRHVAYVGGDGTLPNLVNSVDQIDHETYRDMVFGKRAATTDVKASVPRYNWTTGTTYSAFRSDEDLDGEQFFVVVNEGANYRFFKCLDNNGNTPSTVQPNFADTSAAAEYYATSDGYQWKYMCSVDATTFAKFATPNWAPVVPDTNVSGNAVSGAIDVIVVSTRGSHYNTYLANTFLSADLRVGGDPTKYNLANNASAANSFYTGSFIYITGGTGVGQGKQIVDYVVVGSSKLITVASAFDTPLDVTSAYEVTPSVSISGDGSGAIARAIVNTSQANAISRIQMIERGSGYTFSTANVVGNTGGISNAAVLVVVSGPKGGHGADVEAELGATALSVSVTFANNESNTIPVTNDYRQIGLIKDPLYANVIYTVSSPVGRFNIGETVSQNTSGATGVVTAWDSISTLSLTNVSGIFVTSNLVTGGTSGAVANLQSFTINGVTKTFNTFDQRNKYTYTPISGVFVQDEAVYQTDVQLANAIFHSNNSSFLYLTNVKGTLNMGNTIVGQNSGATANLLVSTPGDIVIGSGEVIYMENINPITRSGSQSEAIKFVLQF